MFEKLGMIIRGNWYRLIGKNETLYWRRNAICRRCPLNSKHKKLTFTQKVWAAFGAFCTDCGCPLQSKLREPLSECPQLYWGQAI